MKNYSSTLINFVVSVEKIKMRNFLFMSSVNVTGFSIFSKLIIIYGQPQQEMQRLLVVHFESCDIPCSLEASSSRDFAKSC